MPIHFKDNAIWHVYLEENDGNGNDLGGGAADPKNDPPEPPKKEEKTPVDPNSFSDNEAKLLKDVMAKKEQIKQLNAQAKELQAKLAMFDGIDPEAVKAMLAKQQQEENDKLERKGEYERLKAQMIEAHKKETAEMAEQIKSGIESVNSLQKQIAELTVGNAFGSSSFIIEDTILTASKTRKLYGDHFEFVDGKVVGYDKPAGESNRTVLVDSMGEPLSFDDALKVIINADPEKDMILKSKIKTGAGSRTQSRTSPPPNQPIFGDRREKIAAGLAQSKK